MATLVEAYVYITKKAWSIELIWPPPWVQRDWPEISMMSPLEYFLMLARDMWVYRAMIRGSYAT
jgi:hypothetical protein